jgi:uncharacterized protein (UPF0335 family)
MEKVAIGRVVLTNCEHIIALEPMDKGLVGTLLRYPMRSAASRSISMRSMTSKSPKTRSTWPSVNQKAGTFEPEKFEDHSETALIDLINQKRAGKTIRQKERPKGENVAADLRLAGASLVRPEITATGGLRSGGARLVPGVLEIASRCRPSKRPRLRDWLSLCAHFHGLIQQGGTMSDITIPGGKIRSFVERIENLDTELQELNEQKKEVFSEAKGEGFDVKILKEIIKLRKQDQDERDERESLLDLYMRAMDAAPADKAAKAA